MRKLLFATLFVLFVPSYTFAQDEILYPTSITWTITTPTLADANSLSYILYLDGKRYKLEATCTDPTSSTPEGPYLCKSIEFGVDGNEHTIQISARGFDSNGNPFKESALTPLRTLPGLQPAPTPQDMQILRNINWDDAEELTTIISRQTSNNSR